MTKPHCLLFLIAFLLPCFGAHAANIQELSLPHKPTRILLSEDHSYLAVTQYDENLVSIINTETLEVEKQFESSNPGPMLSRGNKLYLAEAEKGLIKVYEQESWEQVDELYAGSEKIVQLSAPQGKHFKDSILISFTGLPDNERFVSLLDVEKDEFEVVRKGEVYRAMYSYTGELILEQHQSKARMLASSSYYPGSNDYLTIVDSDNRNNLFQVNDSDLWFSRTYVTTSTSPERLMKDLKGIVVPDSNSQSETCYWLNHDGLNVTIHNLDSSFTEIQTVQFAEGAKQRIHLDSYGRTVDAKQDGRAFAFSKSGNVTLFLIDTRHRLLAIRFALPSSHSATGESYYQKQLPAANSYTLLKSPDGTEISESGLLKWVPRPTDAAGEYDFKVKLDTEDGTEFFRDYFSVTTQATDATMRFPIPVRHDKTKLYTDTGNGQLYIHTDNLVTIFDATGTKRIREAALKQTYQQILATESDLVALAKDKVHFYDLDTLQFRNEVNLGGIKAHNMAYDRKRGRLYVGGFDEKESSGAKAYPILQIDPSSGRVQRTDRALGQTVYISPNSDLMVTSISDSKFHSVGFNYIKQEIEVLSIYRLDHGSPELVDLSESMVTGVTDIQFLADGQHFIAKALSAAYGGQRIYQRSSMFKTDSLKKPVSFIDKKKDNTFGSVVSIAAHPKRNLIAILSAGKNDGSVVPSLLEFRDVEGKQINDLIDPSIPLNNHPASVSFTPDGESLLLINRDFYGRRTIQKITLKLNPSITEFTTTHVQSTPQDQETENIVVPSTPVTSNTTAPTIPQHVDDADNRLLAFWQATELTMSYDERFSPDLIGMINMPAVVIISSEGQSIGTGFFISSAGHILTAAHVIPEIRNPKITCYFETSIYKTHFTLDATVVDVDHDNDLALLKVDTSFSMRSVRLQKRPTYHGAPVYVIGHPGIGNISLNYTMTNGIVSHPNQIYQDKNYLQISAPINPGNSGGPVFDTRGNVIGLVTTKFMMEGVSFAIPVDRIMPFLSKNMDESRKVSPEKKTLYSIQQAADKEGSMTLSEITVQGNVAYLRDTKNPFTGTLICGNDYGDVGIRMRFVNGRLAGTLEEYYANGQLRHSIGYKAGLEDGESRSWYPSGNLMQVYNKRYDQLEGIDRLYYDEPGRVQRMVTYRNGKKNGIAYTMNEVGFIVEKVLFKSDQAIKNTRYYPRGIKPASPFIEFIKAGDLEMVRDFAEASTLVSVPDAAGNYPIHIAVKSDDAAMVALLLQLGADAKALNKDQKTALDLEKEKKNPDPMLIRHLISTFR